MAAALLYASTLPSAVSNVNAKLNYPKGFAGPQLFTGLSKKLRSKNTCHIRCSQSAVKKIEKDNEKGKRKGVGRLILSEGREGGGDYGPICPGCGVFMQNKDPNLPGFFREKKLGINEKMEDDSEDGVDSLLDTEFEDFDVDENEFEDFDEDDEEFEDDIEEKSKGNDGFVGKFVGTDGVEWDLEELEAKFEKEDDELKEVDGFGPAGVGYGNITEETMDKGKKRTMPKSEWKRLTREAQSEKEEVTVCARCHSLRSYGQVKNQTVENNTGF